MEYLKDRAAHGKLDVLLNGIQLGQEYGTILVSSGIVLYGEINMSKVESLLSLNLASVPH